MNAARPARIRMIVNADDFGYFDEVSRGIIDAAERGVVTATGVMANGPALQRWVDKLKAIPTLSAGVHLNATLGCPMTPEMRQALPDTHGMFPPKGAVIASLLSARLSKSVLLNEWRVQIQHCLQLGISLRFVNSHEHIHMLPGLHSQVRALAAEFGIRHVRMPHFEWPGMTNFSGHVRNCVFAALRMLTPRPPMPEPVLIGIPQSGRLDKSYFESRFSRLATGNYELMCHPGWNDAAAQSYAHLHAYHDWEGELHALMSDEFQALLHENDISLISYADLNRSKQAEPLDACA